MSQWQQKEFWVHQENASSTKKNKPGRELCITVYSGKQSGSVGNNVCWIDLFMVVDYIDVRVWYSPIHTVITFVTELRWYNIWFRWGFGQCPLLWPRTRLSCQHFGNEYLLVWRIWNFKGIPVRIRSRRCEVHTCTPSCVRRGEPKIKPILTPV